MSGQVDDLLAALGTGKWNLLHFIATGYAMTQPVPHAFAGAFLTPKVGYTCRTPSTNATAGYNITKRTECSYFLEDLQSGDITEEQCEEWDFDNSTFSSTVTEEFQLVCSREYLRATYQSMYMIGVLVGSPVNGLVADRYGRKFVVAMGTTAFAILALASCWLPTFSSLLLSRFLIGTFHATILKTGFILAMEVAEPKIRSVLSSIVYLPWCLGISAWAGFAYFLRDWRWLLFMASLPCAISMFAVWFLDESPRWLAVQGQQKRALRVLRKASLMNNVSLPSDEEVLCILEQEKIEVPRISKNRRKEIDLKAILKDYLLSAIILFRTPRLRVITSMMYLNLLVVGMIYFGISLSGGNFGLNVFAYMALSGLMDLVSLFITPPTISRLGRRLPLAACFFLNTIVFLVLIFIQSSIPWLSVTLAMVGKIVISSAYIIVTFMSAELFPTEVRTRGISTSFMISQIGSSCAPFITDYLSSIYLWLPSLVFMVACAVAGLATLALPETLGVPLPDTVNQLESRQIPKNKRILLCLRLPAKKAQSSETADLAEGVREQLM